MTEATDYASLTLTAGFFLLPWCFPTRQMLINTVHLNLFVLKSGTVKRKKKFL